ncbi:serpin family protein [Litoribacter alkaliphilus]|uniref:Serpin family protein n=1 Tax=Litoribacter ruber TaxID=702568 RepID=A0AAP2CH84_9BACT|nr:serpin family protein [Litoribacter alkaliphilus]MBS9524656.1 serpin family protein [Litoribacter alkaliphilus]
MRTFLFYSALFLIVASCVGQENPEENLPNLRALSHYEKELSKSSQAFALDFFQQVSDPNENQFYSPYSVQLALAMAMNGNVDEILEEYLEALRFENLDIEDANRAALELTQYLKDVDRKVKLNIANGIWYDRNLNVKVPFKERMEHYYQANIDAADFTSPQVVRNINDWIDRQTEGLIKDMLDSISPDAVMLLVNAIYFKAEWKSQFDRNLTTKKPFKLSNGGNVQVDMMRTKEAASIRASYGVDNSYLEIPYSTGQYSMGIILPENVGLEGIKEELILSNLETWRENSHETSAILEMPKFKMSYKVENLNNDLIAMGLKTPFEGHPRNFSELFEQQPGPLKISRVVHEAIIEVDEKGTEAAAATVVEIVVTSMPSGPRVISIDRPFVFFIQEKASGAILFMGQLVNPGEL